jgi:hypothetical protein
MSDRSAISLKVCRALSHFGDFILKNKVYVYDLISTYGYYNYARSSKEGHYLRKLGHSSFLEFPRKF